MSPARYQTVQTTRPRPVMAQFFVQLEALRARACQLVVLPHTNSPKVGQTFLRMANKPLGPDCD